jgi:hypothetical protein
MERWNGRPGAMSILGRVILQRPLSGCADNRCVADLVGMSDDRARFRKQAGECCQQAESAISQFDRGVAARWMTRQTTQGPGSLRGLFLSIKRWRPHTELQVGTPEAFPR